MCRPSSYSTPSSSLQEFSDDSELVRAAELGTKDGGESNRTSDSQQQAEDDDPTVVTALSPDDCSQQQAVENSTSGSQEQTDDNVSYPTVVTLTDCEKKPWRIQLLIPSSNRARTSL